MKTCSNKLKKVCKTSSGQYQTTSIDGCEKNQMQLFDIYSKDGTSRILGEWIVYANEFRQTVR